MDEAPLRQLYLDFLTEEGYRPTTDDDGDIVFKREGKTYVLFVDDDDPTFFRLVLPNFWPIESEEERTLAYQAATVATGQTKVAKVYGVQDNLWASVELFLERPEQFTAHFTRSLNAIAVAVDGFVSIMRAS